MQRRYLAPLGALAVVLTLISLIAISVAGQAPSPTRVRRPPGRLCQSQVPLQRLPGAILIFRALGSSWSLCRSNAPRQMPARPC